MSFLGTPGQQALPFRVPGFRGSRPIPRKQGIRRLLRRNVRRSRLSASALARTGAEHRPVATPKAPLRAFPRFCISVLLLRLPLPCALWRFRSEAGGGAVTPPLYSGIPPYRGFAKNNPFANNSLCSTFLNRICDSLKLLCNYKNTMYYPCVLNVITR